MAADAASPESSQEAPAANESGEHSALASETHAATSPEPPSQMPPPPPKLSWAERLAANSKASSSSSSGPPAAAPHPPGRPAPGPPSPERPHQSKQQQQPLAVQPLPAQPPALDDMAIASALSAISLAGGDDRAPRHPPRPMRNSGRQVCYLNSCCQALLACSPFSGLASSLQSAFKAHPQLRGLAPALACVAELADRSLGASTVLAADRIFTDVLNHFISTAGAEHRQQDAQEFLSFLLDRMHEELKKLEGLQPQGGDEGAAAAGSNGHAAESDEQAEAAGWVTALSKKKAAVTRSTGEPERRSRLTASFGGALQSTVKGPGMTPSVTYQPFSVLQLGIDDPGINSIDDALDAFCKSEVIQDYKLEKGSKPITVTKSLSIQKAPRVLVVHLTRYKWMQEEGSKVAKPIRIAGKLVLKRNVFPTSPAGESREYGLVATISHIGSGTGSGHYTASVLTPDGSWVVCDDNHIRPKRAAEVFSDPDAYLLIFERKERAAAG